ncbi:MAG: alpha/beta fold hydrolase [Anaerolineae bacterium]
MSPYLGPIRFIANAIFAVVIFALGIIILFTGFVAIYLPMWENAGLDEAAKQGAWMWIDNQPIYYRIWGEHDAPAVVLIHDDVVEGSTTWEASAPMLADSGLRVIALDLPGYGQSARGAEPNYSLRTQAGVLARVLNELRAVDATLVGHGRGAGVVTQLAVEQPQFVKSLVLVSPDLDPAESALWRRIVRVPFVGKAAVWAVESGGPLWKWNRMRMVAEPDSFAEDYFTAAAQPTHVVGTVETRRMIALSRADDNLPEAIPGLQVPALILVGDQDRAISESRAKDLASLFPDAKVVVVPRAAHAVQIDQPVLIVDQIVRLANGTPMP